MTVIPATFDLDILRSLVFLRQHRCWLKVLNAPLWKVNFKTSRKLLPCSHFLAMYLGSLTSQTPRPAFEQSSSDVRLFSSFLLIFLFSLFSTLYKICVKICFQSFSNFSSNLFSKREVQLRQLTKKLFWNN